MVDSYVSEQRASRVKDLDILQAIYEYRILSASQIKRLFFTDSKKYHYRKMQIMRQKGWIASKPHVRNGKKYEVVYYVLQPAIEMLFKNNRIRFQRRWDRNKLLDWRKIERVLDANELFVHLHHWGYTVTEDRTWKETFALYAGSPIRHGITLENSEKYHTFILPDQVEDETIRRIRRFIKEETALSRYMVYYMGPNAARSYMKAMSEDKSVELSKLSFCIMPYEYIALRMPFIGSQNALYDVIAEKYGKPTLFPENKREEATAFVSMQLKHEGSDYLVFNYLMNDFIVANAIWNYPQRKHQETGKKIGVLCWEDQKDRFEKLSEKREDLKVFSFKEHDFMLHPFYTRWVEKEASMDYRNPKNRAKGL